MGLPFTVFSRIFSALGAISDWVNPSVANAIGPALEREQFAIVRKQVPTLLLVAGLNVGIIMAVCAHDGEPLANYAWFSVLPLYCAARLFSWSRMLKEPVDPARIPKIIRFNARAALIMSVVLGADAAYIFVTDMFTSSLMAPISLAFGSLAIAHCFYALKPAAIGVLIFGLLPSATAMIITGDFEAKMIGWSMISVGLLMIRFVAAQYDQLVSNLHMEQQIRTLADTDPLTGLANRRAIMAALQKAHMTGGFAVALLDLDGFKQVNDNMGHQVGDALLKAVAERLLQASQPGDIVGRLGGDEFIVLMQDHSDVSAKATAMLASLCQPLIIADSRVPIAASLGHACYPQDGGSVDEILHVADERLYAVKRSEKPEKSAAIEAVKAA
jgi:diguanylate cyclase